MKIKKPFESTIDVIKKTGEVVDTPQTLSPSYRLAVFDQEFLLSDELRPMRLEMELLKAEMALTDMGIMSTIVVFGGTRIPEQEKADRKLKKAEDRASKAPEDKEAARRVAIAKRIVAKAKYYDEARKFGRIVSESDLHKGGEYVIVTGGGPGIMEAANRGADDEKALNIGLNIMLPMEQVPNKYITPELCFQFHYFAIRKMHFLIRARALVAFPGGFGTLDELFETLTLVQTKKVAPLPILLFGRSFWEKIVNFEALVDEGTIAPNDLDLFKFVETAEEAWRAILEFYGETG